MRPSGPWGPKEFAQFSEDELHETMMGAAPGSNYFEWAKAELEHRDRRRALSTAGPSQSGTGLESTGEDRTLSALVPAVGVQKTVFISYRRYAAPWAQSIFQDLTQHGYDVFFDFQNIASGGFEQVIFESIKARAHFLVLLTPSALERCGDPQDLFRREIETALSTKRNIVPIILDDFSFSAPEVNEQLGPSLLALKQYNGLTVYSAYFSEAMQRLRNKFLNVPLDMVIHPLSADVARAAMEDQAAAARAPAVTEKQLREAIPSARVGKPVEAEVARHPFPEPQPLIRPASSSHGPNRYLIAAALPTAALAVSVTLRIKLRPNPTPLKERIDHSPSGVKEIKGPLTAVDLARFYNFPARYDGQGECIGLIELGGGYKDSDLNTYFKEINLPKPAVFGISVQGAQDHPEDTNASLEVVGDIEVAGSAAPGAHIAVYFTEATAAGLQRAIETAASDGVNRPSVLSISWGVPEVGSWDERLVQKINAALETAAQKNITVLAVSGFSESPKDRKRHVVFPASSPWVLAVGETGLHIESGSISRESVVGIGGFSAVFKRPAWQSQIDVDDSSNTGDRAIPDVAANGDVQSGYKLFIHGSWQVIGGGSMATALWAGLIVRLNQALGQHVGYLNPVLYRDLGPTGALNEVRRDPNLNQSPDTCANSGWNRCTGWGSPDGGKILSIIEKRTRN